MSAPTPPDPLGPHVEPTAFFIEAGYDEDMVREALARFDGRLLDALMLLEQQAYPSRVLVVPPGDGLVPANVLVAMEETMQAGQAEHGDRWRRRSVAHHVGKAMGHARRGLGATPIDADSGQPHLVLAATRMVLAVAVMLELRA